MLKRLNTYKMGLYKLYFERIFFTVRHIKLYSHAHHLPTAASSLQFYNHIILSTSLSK